MKISVDYSEVYQASVYVKNKADSYNDLIQNLYKKVEQMQSIWQGVDHLAFQNQLEEFRPSLNEMYQVILEYSNVLKQTASVTNSFNKIVLHKLDCCCRRRKVWHKFKYQVKM